MREIGCILYLFFYGEYVVGLGRMEWWKESKNVRSAARTRERYVLFKTKNQSRVSLAAESFLQ